MATIRSRFIILGLAAAALVSSTISVGYDRVAAACTAVYCFARDFVAGVPAVFEQPRLVALPHPAELVQACAHALGLAKRERPHVRSQWRMCPSV